ncbi:MAG: NAD(+) synthase [Clostridia bacterium]|nr:NAD(+) synthase [Clostridia bacterium]
MNKYGFIRLATAVPEVKVADTKFNCGEIAKIMKETQKDCAYIALFPELCVTGYTCQDLFLTETLIKGAEKGLSDILQKTKNIQTIGVLGMPVLSNDRLYNCAVVIQKGKILGVVPKMFLPNYNDYYEKRWFTEGTGIDETVSLCGQEVPISEKLIFKTSDFSFGIEICEDMWVPKSPAVNIALAGAELILNLTAGNDVVGKDKHREMLVKTSSFKNHCVYAVSSCGLGESTTDTVYCGNCIVAENGTVISNETSYDFESKVFYCDVDIDRVRCDRRKINSFNSSCSFNPHFIKCEDFANIFTETSRKINKMPFVPSSNEKDKRMEQIFNIQANALAKRLKHIGSKHPVIGVSGGLDSTLALLVIAKAMDIIKLPRENIIAITMPGFGTTGRTYNNSVKLIKELGVTFKEINIKEACLKHFEDIGHNPDVFDLTYENAQARERTQILMDVANKVGGIVVGTGDLSEMALGWSTFSGDHISMYCVNCGVPKTLVRHLVLWITEDCQGAESEILKDIVDTPISPELLPADNSGNIAQKTEDIIGDYAVHDFVLYYFLRFGFTPEKILYLLTIAFGEQYKEEQLKDCMRTFFKRFFNNQFKRNCVPDGPKIGSVSLSPRADFKMSSDCYSDLWTDF